MQGAEGGGEGAFLMEETLIVEVARRTLHPYCECVYGRLYAADGGIRILHGIPSHLLCIVTGLRKIVYMRVKSCGIMGIV